MTSKSFSGGETKPGLLGAKCQSSFQYVSLKGLLHRCIILFEHFAQVASSVNLKFFIQQVPVF